jgi:flavin-dependent dehydrogenase
VLVIGGGPAGCAAALTLARANVAVTLLDAGMSPPGRPKGEYRSAQHEGSSVSAPFAIGEALPPAARPLLASLGLDACVTPQRHRVAFGNRSAWGSEAIAITDFMMHPFGHGWHLDRRRFDADLLDAARESGATIVRGTFRESARAGDHWRIGYHANAELHAIAADVVVDCSGRRAAFARRQGATRRQGDRLVACAALLHTSTPERDTDATTLIEAERNGWWYTAPLPGGTRIVMFATDSDLPAARERRHPEALRAALSATHHVGALCTAANYDVAMPIVVAAADTGRLDRCYGDGWLAAGDAAATFDPISSQGIMTALQCGRDAATAMLEGNEAGYAARVDALFARYAAMRASAYAQELRWPTSSFWQRRRSITGADAHISTTAKRTVQVSVGNSSRPTKQSPVMGVANS